jgi:hypothetical protein
LFWCIKLFATDVNKKGEIMFKRAERKRVKLKLAITGPSGAGKTYSALRLASGMGEKIALIDTENGSASNYSHFTFDVMDLAPPFTVERYVEGVNNAASAGYDLLIIDSISHAWAGPGGLLEQKEKLDARGGNSFTNWAKITPKQNAFMEAILQAPIHIICTMRSKQDYALAQNDRGKIVPQKVGLAPIQRGEVEYEYTTVFDVAIDHYARVSKDRTGLFTDNIFQITEDTGKLLNDWLDGGAVEKILRCTHCNAELKFHKERNMMYCPNKKSADDEHQTITLEEKGKENEL